MSPRSTQPPRDPRKAGKRQPFAERAQASAQPAQSHRMREQPDYGEAPAYVFLASDESRFVNGEVLGVTGGKLLA